MDTKPSQRLACGAGSCYKTFDSRGGHPFQPPPSPFQFGSSAKTRTVAIKVLIHEKRRWGSPSEGGTQVGTARQNRVANLSASAIAYHVGSPWRWFPAPANSAHELVAMASAVGGWGRVGGKGMHAWGTGRRGHAFGQGHIENVPQARRGAQPPPLLLASNPPYQVSCLVQVATNVVRDRPESNCFSDSFSVLKRNLILLAPKGTVSVRRKASQKVKLSQVKEGTQSDLSLKRIILTSIFYHFH